MAREAKTAESRAALLRKEGWHPHRLAVFGLDHKWVGELIGYPYPDDDGCVYVQVRRGVGDPTTMVKQKVAGKSGMTWAKLLPERRVVWDYDQSPDFSWLEQWDTPEKYAGNEHYATNEDGDVECRSCGCGLVRWEADGQSGWRHEGGTCETPEPKILSFDEYAAGPGNPDNHTMLEARLQERCRCCDKWYDLDSLGGVDFFSSDTINVGAFGVASREVGAMKTSDYLAPYQREVMREMFSRLPDRHERGAAGGSDGSSEPVAAGGEGSGA